MAQETDDFLAHYGVLGMKWGRRGASGGGSGSSGPSRSDLRALNKTARAENRTQAKSERKAANEKSDKEIGTARAAIPHARAVYKDAKVQYKADKKVIGSVAARRTLAVHGDRLTQTLQKANEYTTKEQNERLVATLLGGEAGKASYDFNRAIKINSGRA